MTTNEQINEVDVMALAESVRIGAGAHSECLAAHTGKLGACALHAEKLDPEHLCCSPVYLVLAGFYGRYDSRGKPVIAERAYNSEAEARTAYAAMVAKI